MRPDEHKKKKNAAYKKKHGIASKDGATSEDKEKDQNQRKTKDGASAKVKEKQRRHGDRDQKERAESKKSQHCFRENKDGSETDTASSEDEVQRSCQGKAPEVKKSFRRREIVSNWEKYELKPQVDEDEVVAKGEDFQKLLESTSSALSHFRFKDELDWDSDLAASVNDQDNTSHILSINPTRIAESLSCLPIHTILDIDTDIFSAEQLAANIAVAEKNREALAQRSKVSHPITGYDPLSDTSFSDPLQEENLDHLYKTSVLSSTLTNHSEWTGPSRSQTSTGGSEGLQQSSPKKSKPKSKNIQILDQQNESISKNGTPSLQPPSKPDSTSIEDDLDFLLSLDSPHSMPTIVESNQKKNDNDVRETVGAQASNESSGDRNITTEKKDASENDDLEDWLDSVLDS